jgi:hypothetical protein
MAAEHAQPLCRQQRQPVAGASKQDRTEPTGRPPDPTNDGPFHPQTLLTRASTWTPTTAGAGRFIRTGVGSMPHSGCDVNLPDAGSAGPGRSPAISPFGFARILDQRGARMATIVRHIARFIVPTLDSQRRTREESGIGAGRMRRRVESEGTRVEEAIAWIRALVRD